VTDNSPGLGVPSLNQQIQTSLTTDSDGDGYLDLSLLLIFRPLDQAAAGANRVDVAQGLCPPP